MKEPCFYALVFCFGEKSFAQQMTDLQKEFEFLRVVDLSEDKNLVQQLKIKNDTVILVRPDHYIGLVTDKGGNVVKEYLKKISNS
jgi:hypothetical protein